MYDKTSSSDSVNECRRMLYTKKARAIECIPPTENALIQHIKRAKLISVIWINCLNLNIPEIDYTCWGWVRENNVLQPLWMTIPEASKSCREIKRCGCKKRCSSSRCTCRKFELNCTHVHVMARVMIIPLYGKILGSIVLFFVHHVNIPWGMIWFSPSIDVQW